MSDANRYGEADKLHWEVKKCEAEAGRLEAERLDLLRNPLTKPGFWFSAIPAVVAVVGVGLQYYASALEYRKSDILRAEAEVKKEQAEFRVAQVKQQLDDLDKEVKGKQSKLDEITKLTGDLDAVRAAKDAEVRNLTQLVENLKSEKVNRREQLDLLDQSLLKLQSQQQQTAALSKEQSKLLSNLGRIIGSHATGKAKD